jgi:hypothetical protein
MVSLMGTGIYLSYGYKQDFKVMNEILIFEWLKKIWPDHPVLAIWFILLCISAAFLFVNVLCCSLTKQIHMAKKSGKLEKWLFFILHCLFIMVLACHGLILVVGHKQTNVTLFAHEKISFKNQYVIEVTDVAFKDDIRILKAPKSEQRALMTQKDIHRKQNFAQISLYQHSTLLETKEIMMLSPLRHGSIQITLTEFIVKETDHKDRIGVKLTMTENHLNIFFFMIYGLMILCLVGYVLLIFHRELSLLGH